MIHLQPVSENTSDSRIKIVYSDLKTLLRLKTVPTYFQFIATFPEFLELLWLKLRPVVATPEFQESVSEIAEKIRQELVKEIPTNPTIDLLVPKIDQHTKNKMAIEFEELQRVNATLLLISVLIRERIKGLQEKKDPALFLPGGKRPQTGSELVTVNETDLATLESGVLAFSPLGTDPYFVTYMKLVSQLMDEFARGKEYLQLRVFLENTAQNLLKAMPTQIDLPYQAIMVILAGKVRIDELLYLLHDAFPAYFPKQLLSSLLLELGLYPREKIPQIGGKRLILDTKY